MKVFYLQDNIWICENITVTQIFQYNRIFTIVWEHWIMMFIAFDIRVISNKIIYMVYTRVVYLLFSYFRCRTFVMRLGMFVRRWVENYCLLWSHVIHSCCLYWHRKYMTTWRNLDRYIVIPRDWWCLFSNLVYSFTWH